MTARLVEREAAATPEVEELLGLATCALELCELKRDQWIVIFSRDAARPR